MEAQVWALNDLMLISACKQGVAGCKGRLNERLTWSASGAGAIGISSHADRHRFSVSRSVMLGWLLDGSSFARNLMIWNSRNGALLAYG